MHLLVILLLLSTHCAYCMDLEGHRNTATRHTHHQKPDTFVNPDLFEPIPRINFSRIIAMQQYQDRIDHDRDFPQIPPNNHVPIRSCLERFFDVIPTLFRVVVDMLILMR